MGKRFRTDHINQSLLLPPSLHDWLPEGHWGRFIADVTEELDLGPIYRSYEGDGRGLAAYQPLLMVRLLLYGYCKGVASSRKIEQATYEDVAFRYLSGDRHPDHDTIAAFRKRHLSALAGLFVQVLQLCQKAGLVKLGHVAIDGTKMKANASKHKAMSYERMKETEQRLRQEVEELLRQAAAVDEAEDAQYGKGRRGDELPEELQRRESRLKKIREAKAELEQEAKEEAEQLRAEAEATGPPPEEATLREAMEHKLRTEAGRSIYKMRKAIVEPVFGQIKERRGCRRFSFRGLRSVGLEWELICLTGNLLKLFRFGRTPQVA